MVGVGGESARSFHDVLTEIYDVHKQELDSQRAHYEKELKEVHKEKEQCRSLLDSALRQLHVLDPSIDLKKPELMMQAYQAASEAGSSVSAPMVTATADAPAKGTVPAAAAPEYAPSERSRWLWEIVGGEDKGGILVRQCESIDSLQFPHRLATGSVVEELERKGDRLKFARLTGAGPKRGWITTRANGRDLALRVDQPLLRLRQPPPTAVGPDGEPPLPIVLIFPEEKLAKDVLSIHQELPPVRDALEAVRNIMSIDTMMLCGCDKVYIWQLALSFFIASLAALERLKAQRPEVVRRAGGIAALGAGQYVALCAAGVISVEDGLKLVKARATAQYEATGLVEQKTISVSGMEEDYLHLLCLRACKMEGEGAICQISHHFSRKFFWVGGKGKAMDMLESMVRRDGGRVQTLLPSAPHTPLMAPCCDSFAAEVDEVLPRMKPPLYTVWSSATGEPVRPGCDPADIASDLKNELRIPVLASQCIEAIRQEGMTKFYQVQISTERYEPLRTKSKEDRIDPWGVEADNATGTWFRS